jgi:hypothetical protein
LVGFAEDARLLRSASYLDALNGLSEAVLITICTDEVNEHTAADANEYDAHNRCEKCSAAHTPKDSKSPVKLQPGFAYISSRRCMNRYKGSRPCLASFIVR